MTIYETSGKFIAEYGQDVFDELFNSLYQCLCSGDRKYGNVNFYEIYKINAICSEASGYIEFENSEVEFHIEDGDGAGSRLISYGEEIEPPKYYATVARFVLDERLFSEEHISFAKRKFNSNLDEVKKKESDYNYDRYVTGNSAKTEKYYRKYLNENNLKIEWETIEVDVY